ncbi:digeranylgeranylglycerophospholipid reductase [Thermoplasmatales archaeon ex4484_30]|nr:MAG: digeranylgeranylglycerophospholipid reductase [Thermoplasmatales archaeon ex4484_30]
MKKECIIIGAGPAGSLAAKELAERGIETLVIERKQEIGPPKRCAEGVTIRGLEIVGIKINQKCIAGDIKGAFLYSPSGKKVEMMGEEMEGYVLERKIFEKHLASEAIKAGAEYMVKTQAIGMERKNKSWVVKINGLEEGEIETNLVIGADGVDSKVGRWAGLGTLNKITDYHSCLQYEMAGVDVDTSVIHIFFGREVAPGGYAWIFPKGEVSANVGLGILEKMAKGKRAYDYLQNFIANHEKIFEKASPIEVNAGGVPVAHFTKMAGDGVMLIGDAAQLVNPIHGGGITRAMHSAQMAAEVAAKALKEGDLSAERLMEYERKWDDEYEEKTKKLMKLRSFLEKLEDKDFELLADILQGEDIFALTQAKLKFFIKKVITKPSLMGLVKKYLVD